MIAFYNEHSSEMLGSGTGFISQTDVGLSLVTARHCLTGRDHFTGKLGPNGAISSEVRIYHRAAYEDGSFRDICLIKSEKLYNDDNEPNWYEHSGFADLCDFAFLPLTSTEGCHFHEVNLQPGLIELTSCANNIYLENSFIKDDSIEFYIGVGEQVSVVGYPFGAFTGSGLPLWTTGYISSEPDLRFSFTPNFIDCRARKGQSGSPVYIKRRGEIPVRGPEGISIDGDAYVFFGLYSGRINENSDIGLVWPAVLLSEAAAMLSSTGKAKIPIERNIGRPISRLGQT